MNKLWSRCLFATILVLAATAVAMQSPGVSGQWKAEIETPIGLLKYVYTFKADGAALTGKIAVETQEGKLEMDIKEGKVSGDSISFVEPFKFQDNEIRIEYQGKLSGDEIKFERKVGDFGTETMTAHRIAAPRQ